MMDSLFKYAGRGRVPPFPCFLDQGNLNTARAPEWRTVTSGLIQDDDYTTPLHLRRPLNLADRELDLKNVTPPN